MAQINRRPSAVRRADIMDAPDTFTPEAPNPFSMSFGDEITPMGGPFDPMAAMLPSSEPVSPIGSPPAPTTGVPKLTVPKEVDKSTWTGLTSSGIPYDESLYGEWHHYATPAGKEELKKAFSLSKGEGLHRRDVLGRTRVLPTGYWGSPDFYERIEAADRKFTDKVDTLVAGGMRSADAKVIADADPSIWKGYAHMDPGEGSDGSPSVGYWGEDPTHTPLWTYDPFGDGSTWLSGGH